MVDPETNRMLAQLRTDRSDVFALAWTNTVRCYLSISIKADIRHTTTTKGNVLLHGDRRGIVRSHDLRAPVPNARECSHLPPLRLASSACALHVLRDQHYVITASLGNQVRLLLLLLLLFAICNVTVFLLLTLLLARNVGQTHAAHCNALPRL